MRRRLVVALLTAFTSATLAQSPAPAPTITTQSTLVLVPTLVRSHTGELVPDLHAADFRVTDNGIEQKISLEQLEHQAVAVVILLQTGGAAARQFVNYSRLAPVVDYLLASSAHRVALVTFDSRPEELWNFPPRLDGLADAFDHPEPGDEGAALLDATAFATDLLKQQPATSRRIILLLSQQQDVGSETHPDEVLRRLGDTNTTLYSVSFSPEKTWAKDQFTRPRHANKLYAFGPDHPPLDHTFDLGTPLSIAWKALGKNTAAQLATASGGESLQFGNRNELESRLAALANDLPNVYTLSFQPSFAAPGLHTLSVEVLHQPAATSVTARHIYWASETPATY